MYTIVATVGYVLYLCTESIQTCDVVRRDVITPQGVEHLAEIYGLRKDCLNRAAALSKVPPDKDLHYFVAYNKWYACREESADTVNRIQGEGR
jgi:hypothetical protein